MVDKKTIWIVDDDSEDREIFRDALSNTGLAYDLKNFENGSAALEELDRSVPDILFLDLNMPPLDGYGTLSAIRKHEKFRAIPRIVIFTTSKSKADQDETFRMGASMFLTKPNDFAELKRAISQILQMDWIDWESDKKSFLYK